MIKLAAMLWIIIGSMSAGAFVIATLLVPNLPISDGLAIGIAAIIGYSVAIPTAIVIAKKLLA